MAAAAAILSAHYASLRGARVKWGDIIRCSRRDHAASGCREQTWPARARLAKHTTAHGVVERRASRAEIGGNMLVAGRHAAAQGTQPGAPGPTRRAARALVGQQMRRAGLKVVQGAFCRL